MRFFSRVTAVALSMTLIWNMCVPCVIDAKQSSGVKLNKNKSALTVGKSVTLKLKGAKKKGVTWKNSDKKTVRVTVNKKDCRKATVKALKAGSATITAKYKKKKYKCKVKVSDQKITPTAEPEETIEPTATPEDTADPTATPNSNYHCITQAEAKIRMGYDDGHVIVDVRREDEYAEGHIAGAILIPNETIGTEMPEKLPDLDQIILIYCRSGNRSKQAASKLADIGYTNLYEFGGINTWPYGIVK